MPQFRFGQNSGPNRNEDFIWDSDMSSNASPGATGSSPKDRVQSPKAVPGRRKFSIAIPPRNLGLGGSTLKTPTSHALKSPDEAYNSDGGLLSTQSLRRRGLSTSSEGPNIAVSDGADNDIEGGNPRKRGPSDAVDYPRRRATIACEICRGRKSRCDGAKPRCRLCTELNAECVYREPGIKLDAGDKLILERLNRIEGLLQTSLVSPTDLIGQTKQISLNPNSPTMSNGTSLSREDFRAPEVNDRAYSVPVIGLGTWSTANQGTNISTMPKVHTTPALHLLQWPMIRDLVSRPYDPQHLLQLELAREPLQLSPNMSLDLGNTGAYVQAFFERVNVWYACVNPYTWQRTYRAALSQGFRSGGESCVSLLVLALGAASLGGSISNLPMDSEPPGMAYFGAAWALLPSVLTRNNTLAAQSLVLASAYLFYLVRPLEAWTLLNSASTKLQLLLGARDRIPAHNKELAERVYWNALLFESDLLAELDLPHSGIVAFEETVGLPCGFEEEDDYADLEEASGMNSHHAPASTPTPPPGRDELWYFLAEIALRRLLNRVSHVIYNTSPAASAGGISLTTLGPIAAELDFQLAQWYEGLPRALQFPYSKVPLSSPVQTVLRLRYFACRTIIFRPYILAVLDNEGLLMDPAVRDNCHKCLEASVRQLEHITAHQAGHLPYLWQGALSIVSQTLLVMGATMSMGLAGLLPPMEQMDAIFLSVREELERLGALAPSLRLGAEIVREADERRGAIMRGQGMRL